MQAVVAVDVHTFWSQTVNAFVGLGIFIYFLPRL